MSVSRVQDAFGTAVLRNFVGQQVPWQNGCMYLHGGFIGVRPQPVHLNIDLNLVCLPCIARPELLYGRPALAALRVQHDALQQLYCTYEITPRTENGSGGISRGIFLKVRRVGNVQLQNWCRPQGHFPTPPGTTGLYNTMACCILSHFLTPDRISFVHHMILTRTSRLVKEIESSC